ncbi:heavy-metal-associated domain-containing protein [Halegenticoccus soli]|uniref:heavy-metal-associated domain-containing protein n=1 Tax=Halegenticoccus soli TaxID=1985678 RepID=UPI000C6D161F|nr:heavy-metal-associated domain-containing protein [Halegenticoccus soli]
MATTLTVEGMSCSGCEETVVEALERVDGVERATADSDTDTATVDGRADPLDLVTAVQDAGYEARAR